METTVISHGINVESSINISETGKISTNVKADIVFMDGRFKGELEAENLIQIPPSGVVKGNIKVKGRENDLASYYVSL